MASRPAGLPELEPISPELVLVSPPEVARRAREELRERPFWDTTPAVRERLPEPRARADPPQSPQLPSRRRRGRVAAIAVALVAIAAAVAYLVVTRDDTRRVDPAAVTASATSTKPATRPSTAAKKTTTSAAARATPARHRHTSKAVAPRRPARTSKRPAATATHAAKPKRAVEPKRPQRTAKPKRAQSQPAKHAKPTKQRPAAGRASGFVPARTWTWPASDGARAYVMRLLLNGRVVLEGRTAQPQLVLPHTFRFRAGTYRWLVERVPPARNGRPIVDSTFVLTRVAAARANG